MSSRSLKKRSGRDELKALERSLGADTGGRSDKSSGDEEATDNGRCKLSNAQNLFALALVCFKLLETVLLRIEYLT